MTVIKLSALDHIFEKYEKKKGNLIPVLHDIQEEIGYLPVEVQRYASKKLGVAMSKIYGVISFYSFFTTEPKGEHTIGVCMGTACYVKGAEDILNRLKEELEIETGQTTADNKFTMTVTRCLGTCSMAPVIMIDEQVHGNLTAAKIPEIINKY
ncbi:NADH-quinone oxidoreductase subunit NuoE [Halanaerobium sp. ST460_2HS_T2]|uniref:NADH-quinone oxidoreductase subunit NuoE n=1 Tax=Halanaerobium sp. ST460_2HS_T2 TaxID=2183914 RepID=UPI000DF42E75|nr:NADH-quinone oxidoreductase subunit NuoE [Halanaerobium sp. ST460_2HS_T2]RCW56249.1 NAD(P)-dependent iron-only hydrogenase diaphorase component iron-sulfur protein [Halanaerobium sp. ST460_2HS_T2]